MNVRVRDVAGVMLRVDEELNWEVLADAGGAALIRAELVAGNLV